METHIDGLLQVDLATLKGYFERLEQEFPHFSSRIRRQTLDKVRSLISNNRSPEVSGFDPDAAEECRQQAGLSREQLRVALNKGVHAQTLLKYEHGELIPDPTMDQGKAYVERLSKNGYTPDIEKMKHYHSPKKTLQRKSK